VPSFPPASVIFKAHQRHHQAVQVVAEARRSETPLLIFSGADFSTRHQAALLTHLPERDDVQDGGYVLLEKITFSIRKEIMPVALLKRTQVRCSLKGMEGQTYRIDVVKQKTGDHIAWLYEAHRDQGGDAV
jgi:hypothetical protein